MTYLRTKEQIIQFCTENEIEHVSAANISEYLEDKLDLTPLGYFQSVNSDGFFTYCQRGGHKTQDNQFNATAEVLDFIINAKILSDSNGEGVALDRTDKIVKLFGKMKEGKIQELFALNTGNYFETSGVGRQKRESADLWF